MDFLETVFIAHLLSTAYMAGLCWFVQMVHYPLFYEIDLDKFPAYERKNFVTGYVTVPVMTVEIISGFILLYHSPDFVNLLNMALLLLIWLSTFFFQAPIHLKLSVNATKPLLDRLILSNWIRTVSWTVRVVLLGWVLSGLL